MKKGTGEFLLLLIVGAFAVFALMSVCGLMAPLQGG